MQMLRSEAELIPIQSRQNTMYRVATGFLEMSSVYTGWCVSTNSPTLTLSMTKAITGCIVDAVQAYDEADRESLIRLSEGFDRLVVENAGFIDPEKRIKYDWAIAWLIDTSLFGEKKPNRFWTQEFRCPPGLHTAGGKKFIIRSHGLLTADIMVLEDTNIYLEGSLREWDTESDD